MIPAKASKPLRQARLDRLRSFVALSEELHFGRAAQRLNLSQPALTLQIKGLESELGTELITRGKRRSELTPAGRAFLREARIALYHLELGAVRAKEAAVGSTGRITVGFSYDYHHGLLPRVVADFTRRNPDVAVDLRLDLSAELVRAVIDHTLDVAFVSAPLERETRELQQLELPSKRLVALLPADHRLAHRRRIDLSLLKGERFILPPLVVWSGFHRQLARLFEEAEFAPFVAMDVLDVTLIANLVAEGAGVSLVSVASVPKRVPGVVYVELTQRSTVTSLAMIWRAKDRSAVIENFIASLKHIVGRKRMG
jgi:DNA-binding transcriptional LysR family regulator